MAFWKKKTTTQTFADIIRGMQYAVNTAHEMLERHHITLLNKYFDCEGRPEKKELWLNTEQKIEVPIITLINQGALSIDEMEICFKSKIDGITVKSAPATGTGKDIEIDRTTFEMNFTPSERDGNVVDVRIKFKSIQPPEGVSRIVDEYNKILEPVKGDFIEKDK